MEATLLSAPFPQFLSEFLDPIAPDPVVYGVLQAAGDENLRAQDLAPLLHSGATYQKYLFSQTFLSERMAAWESENEKLPNREEILLDRILRLLGKVPVRNLIACAQVARLRGSGEEAPEPARSADIVAGSSEKKPKEPKEPEEEKITVTPSEEIPFALAAEKTCEDKNWINPEGAFCAGLHYDWLAAIVEKRGGSTEEVDAVDEAFAEGLQIGKMAYELGERIKEIELGKSLFAAGVLVPLGKALMACFFPSSQGAASWSEFAKSCDEAGTHVFDHYRIKESKAFPVTYAELGSLFVNFGALLRPIEKALAFVGDPERLRREELRLYQLSSLLSVAERLARFGTADPPLEPYQLRWMSANGLNEGVLKSAVAAAKKAK